LPKFGQFAVLNIVPILLCVQILVHPIPAALGHNNGAVEILTKALLEDAATQIIGLTQHHLADGCTKFCIRDERLSRSLGKPGCFEYPLRSFIRAVHIFSIAPGAIEFGRNIFKPFAAIGLPNSYFNCREAVNPQIAARIGLM
jgi:hypothetical protein